MRRGMRKAALAALIVAVLVAAAPSAEVLDGTAESLPLGDSAVDAVTVAQAFHWFDARAALAEIARVVRPGGAAALVWNVRDLADPVQARFHELLLPYRGDTPNEHDRPWLADVSRSARLGRLGADRRRHRRQQ